MYGGGSRWTRWEFESESGRHVAEVSGPTTINDSEAMYNLVCVHQGIALIPRWVMGNAIDLARVRWLLQDYYPLAQRVNAVYPRTRFLSRRPELYQFSSRRAATDLATGRGGLITLRNIKLEYPRRV
ncbi:MAG: hypothetical protein EXR86_06020 [Gammaproteobacteria bacterium]|nr:hypothetical protein [Gammaproteobacteria bacterium]